MVFSMLSTESLIAPKTVSWHHAPMPNKPFVNVSERLDYVIRTCEYPNQTALAAALNESNQTLTNWRNRNSIGRGGPKLRRVTGVSSDWMSEGIGEPFPDGPILYSPASLTEQTSRDLRHIGGDIDQLRYTVLAIVDWLSDSIPGAAVGIRERLAEAHPEYSRKGFQSRLLTVLDELAANEAAKRKRPLPPGVPGASGRKRAS